MVGKEKELVTIRRILSFSAGFAVFVVTIKLCNVGLHAYGRHVDQNYQQRVARLSGKSPTMALLKTKDAKGWTLSGCTMVRPKQQDEQVAEEGASSAPSSTSMIGEKAIDQLENASKFLDCIARTEPRKLCEKVVRTAFVSDVATFLMDYKSYSWIGVTMNPKKNPNPPFAQILDELAKSDTEFSNVVDDSTARLEASYPRVMDALKDAASKGYLRAGDFGMFAPEVVTKEIGTLKALAQPCRYGQNLPNVQGQREALQ
jgi:hypothetical protein